MRLLVGPKLYKEIFQGTDFDEINKLLVQDEKGYDEVKLLPNFVIQLDYQVKEGEAKCG